MSKYSLVAYESKQLPYTITDIGTGPQALEAWKVAQGHKMVLWETKKAVKLRTVVQKLDSGSISETIFKESATTKAYKRRSAYVAGLLDIKPPRRETIKLDPPTVYQKITNYLKGLLK